MNKNHIATCVALNDGKFTTKLQTSLASNVPAVVCVMLLFNANLPGQLNEVLSAVLLRHHYMVVYVLLHRLY